MASATGNVNIFNGLRILSVESADEAKIHSKLITQLGGVVSQSVENIDVVLVPETWPEDADASILLALDSERHNMVKSAWLDCCLRESRFIDQGSWKAARVPLTSPLQLTTVKNLRFYAEDDSAEDVCRVATEMGALRLSKLNSYKAHVIVTNPVTSIQNNALLITRFCWSKLVQQSFPHSCDMVHRPLAVESFNGSELRGEKFLITLRGDEKKFVDDMITQLGGELIVKTALKGQQLDGAICIGDSSNSSVLASASKLNMQFETISTFVQSMRKTLSKRHIASSSIPPDCHQSALSQSRCSSPALVVDNAFNEMNICFNASEASFKHKSLIFLLKLRDFLIANTSGLGAGVVQFSIKRQSFPLDMSKVIFHPPTDFLDYPKGGGQIDVYPHMMQNKGNVVVFGFYKAVSQQDLLIFHKELLDSVRQFFTNLKYAVSESKTDQTITFSMNSIMLLKVAIDTHLVLTILAPASCTEFLKETTVLPSFISDPQVIILENTTRYHELENELTIAKIQNNSTTIEKGSPIIIKDRGDEGFSVLRRVDGKMFKTNEKLGLSLIHTLLSDSDTILCSQ